jgi:hypothetical protein
LKRLQIAKIQRFTRRAALIALSFLSRKRNAALAGLLLLCAIALADYLGADFARRTFVFKDIDTGQDRIEERMIMRTESRESDINRYVEEVILGPFSPGTMPLIDRNTRLEALLLRENTVYLNFSEEAAIPLAGNGILDSFEVLRGGITRNFPFVKKVRMFIAGNEIVSD